MARARRQQVGNAESGHGSSPIPHRGGVMQTLYSHPAPCGRTGPAPAPWPQAGRVGGGSRAAQPAAVAAGRGLRGGRCVRVHAASGWRRSGAVRGANGVRLRGRRGRSLRGVEVGDPGSCRSQCTQTGVGGVRDRQQESLVACCTRILGAQQPWATAHSRVIEPSDRSLVHLASPDNTRV